MVIDSFIKKNKLVSPIEPHISNLYEIGLLNSAVQEELKASYTYEKKFHSLHESESVIREEIEEVAEELSKVQGSFELIHQAMRNDAVDSYVEALGYLRQHGWDLLHEAVQVVAMAQKSIDSFQTSAEEKLNHFDSIT